jgi:hypothetical protein
MAAEEAERTAGTWLSVKIWAGIEGEAGAWLYSCTLRSKIWEEEWLNLGLKLAGLLGADKEIGDLGGEMARGTKPGDAPGVLGARFGLRGALVGRIGDDSGREVARGTRPAASLGGVGACLSFAGGVGRL